MNEDRTSAISDANPATPTLQAWYKAARPRTLTATYAPLLLAGTVTIHDGLFDLLRFVLALFGLLLVAFSGPLLLWIGIGGVIVVIFYTAGPAPLAYLGLGEIAVFIFMGPLMTLGTYYARSGTGS